MAEIIPLQIVGAGNGAGATVFGIGTDSEGRYCYRWIISGPNGTIQMGDGLRGGVGMPFGPDEAMRALGSFLMAFSEAQRYPHSENRDLFVPEVAEVADDIVEVIYSELVAD